MTQKATICRWRSNGTGTETPMGKSYVSEDMEEHRSFLGGQDGHHKLRHREWTSGHAWATELKEDMPPVAVTESPGPGQLGRTVRPSPCLYWAQTFGRSTWLLIFWYSFSDSLNILSFSILFWTCRECWSSSFAWRRNGKNLERDNSQQMDDAINISFSLCLNLHLVYDNQ